MGTNYYVKAPQPCDHCGQEHICKQGIHIGKSSAGWKFTFAWNGGAYYKSYGEMERWLADKQIYDEYNRPVSQKDFFNMVEQKMHEANDHIEHNKAAGDDPAAYGVIVNGIYFMDGEFS